MEADELAFQKLALLLTLRCQQPFEVTDEGTQLADLHLREILRQLSGGLILVF